MLYELKSIREKSGRSRGQAAKDLGVSLNTYRNWEQCVNMPRDKKMMKKIADYLHVSIEALLGYDAVEPGAISRDVESDMQYVPLYGRIAAGTPLYMEKVEDHYPIPSEMMRRHPSAFLLRVDGESMSNVLPNGCLALIDPKLKEPVINGRPYAVCVNGYEATIKRILKLDNGFKLEPDSKDPTFKPIIYDYGVEGTDEITVIGEVVWYMVPFDFEI